MLSGRRLDLLDPSPLDIEIEDIAHGLARVARWNGQTRGPHAFSVAQHSVMVERVATLLSPNADAGLRLTALLHDAPEYVIGDMISPFKAMIGDAYRTVEDRLSQAIHLRFGLPARMPPKVRAAVKRADTICAYHEATRLADFSAGEARRFFGRPEVAFEAVEADLVPLSAEEAQTHFVERFMTLESAL